MADEQKQEETKEEKAPVEVPSKFKDIVESIEKMFDSVIVVFAKLNNRLKRVMERDNLKRTEVLARVRRQIPLEDKKKWADFVIDNDGTTDDLKKQVERIYENLMSDIETAKRIRV